MNIEPSASSRSPELISFHATTVTGSQNIPVESEPELSVRAVTESIVHRMGLPQDVTWALRDDHSSAYLDDSRPIGDQLEPGARVSITAKAHLGGGIRPVA
jgi:hypothetical protein